MGLVVANLSLYGKVIAVGGKKVTKSEGVGEKKASRTFFYFFGL